VSIRKPRLRAVEERIRWRREREKERGREKWSERERAREREGARGGREGKGQTDRDWQTDTGRDRQTKSRVGVFRKLGRHIGMN
jgi:hypothetical protein